MVQLSYMHSLSNTPVTFPPCETSASLQTTEQAWKGLHARLMWTRRYARINALALRKISKKHDKVLGSSKGHQFLQVRHSSACRTYLLTLLALRQGHALGAL